MSDPRVERLRRVPLFAACSGKQLEFIARHVEELDLPSRMVLCREGQSGGDFFILLSGGAEVTAGGKHLRTLGEGDFFGEIALLDNGPRTATVTVTEPARALILGPTQFRDVLHQNAEIAVTMLHAVVQRLRSGSQLPHG
jgi:CRP/FNR family cyclic AMP-dependent transcriptional regulator